jgi:hypothetical protein
MARTKKTTVTKETKAALRAELKTLMTNLRDLTKQTKTVKKDITAKTKELRA